jgi:hypothetical protein
MMDGEAYALVHTLELLFAQLLHETPEFAQVLAAIKTHRSE